MNYTDEELIRMLKGKDKNIALEYIYQKWQRVARKIIEDKKITQELFYDFYHETIIAFEQKIISNSFQKGSQLRTYFIGIFKNLLSKYNDKKRRFGAKQKVILKINASWLSEDNPESGILSEEKKEIMVDLLRRLDDSLCQEILWKWALHYNMKEIADITGLPDAERTRKRRYGCMEKLRKLVDRRPFLMKKLEEIYGKF